MPCFVPSIRPSMRNIRLTDVVVLALFSFFFALLLSFYLVVNHSVITGEQYNNNFVDLVRFDSKGKIVQLKEFHDTEHMHRHVGAHEEKNKKPAE